MAEEEIRCSLDFGAVVFNIRGGTDDGRVIIGGCGGDILPAGAHTDEVMLREYRSKAEVGRSGVALTRGAWPDAETPQAKSLAWGACS